MSNQRAALLALVLLTTVGLSQPLLALERRQRIGTVVTRELHSRILDEDRILRIGLPVEYDSTTASYPVFYLLDGDQRRFSAALSELNALLDSGQIPPMILVGIPNTDRDRDMLPVVIPGRRNSGGSARFLRFVREEMIPFVKESYRTSDFSVIMGTSNTALFAVYAFVNEPSTFSAYLASSPMIGYCPELLRSTTEQLLNRKTRLDRSLFVIYGERDSPKVTEAVPVFIEQLRSHMPDGLRLELVVLPGEGHVPPSSLTRGMEWIYSGFNTP